MTIGCCGQNREIAQLAAAADMHPRTTKAGQRARARLALALVEQRALAAGDVAFAARARRSLGNLGTATTADEMARRAAVQSAISTVRAQRGDGTADRWRTQRAAVRDATQVDIVLAILRSLVGIAQGVAAGEATAERTRAAAEGRDVNYTSADTEKALSWVSWMLGGSFPIDVGERDLRIFNSILNNPGVVTGVEAALTGGALPAAAAGQRELSGFLTWLQGYYRTMRTTTAAAVASLPVPAPPPPPTPPADPPPGLNLTRAQWSNLSTTQRRRLIAAMNSGTPPEKKSSSALLVLPAAALAWYLFM